MAKRNEARQPHPPHLQRKNIDFYIENFIAFIDFHFAVCVKRKECKYKKAAGRVGPEPACTAASGRFSEQSTTQ